MQRQTHPQTHANIHVASLLINPHLDGIWFVAYKAATLPLNIESRVFPLPLFHSCCQLLNRRRSFVKGVWWNCSNWTLFCFQPDCRNKWVLYWSDNETGSMTIIINLMRHPEAYYGCLCLKMYISTSLSQFLRGAYVYVVIIILNWYSDRRASNLTAYHRQAQLTFSCVYIRSEVEKLVSLIMNSVVTVSKL